MPIVIVQDEICCVGLAGKIQVISRNIIAEDRNITFKLKIAGSASSNFAAASCTLSYRQQTTLHLVSMIWYSALFGLVFAFL